MDGEVYLLWILIAVIAGIAHLVRKAFEKMSSGAQGKRIDLAGAMHARIRRYLDPMEKGGAASGPTQDPAEHEVQEAPRLRVSPGPLDDTLPPPLSGAPPSHVESRQAGSQPDRPRKRLRKSLRDLTTDSPPLPPAGVPRHGLLDRDALKRAIVLAEMLGPPMAEREHYRLF